MQTTPNLGLPQFEPTDKYRLEDYNEAYAKIDEKIKEAQDLIATWTQFKNNGGDVGGAINQNGNATMKSIGSHSTYKEGLSMFAGDDSIRDRLVLINNASDKALRPWTNDWSWNLGQSFSPFKDLYLGGVSKAPTGYTKLPNGLILQWASFTSNRINNEIDNKRAFPIVFPNECLKVVYGGHFQDENGNVGSGGIRLYLAEKDGVTFRSSANQSHRTVTQALVHWYAIGY